MQEKANNEILFYWVDNDIYFIASTVISQGLFIAKNDDGKPIGQKVLSNCNSEHLSIPPKTKSVVVSIISENLQYTKTVK